MKTNRTSFIAKFDATYSRFFAEMSKKRQRCAVINLQHNFSISAKFTDVYCNYKQQLLFLYSFIIDLLYLRPTTDLSLKRLLRKLFENLISLNYYINYLF
jgi:hypothetical protein